MIFGRKKSQLALTALLAMLAGGGFWPAAHAQQSTATSTPTPTPSTTAQAQPLEEVTVTGSRIKRTTDFNTPTPTTVLDSDVLNNLGVVNLGQALQAIPSNLSQFTPANTSNSSFFTGSYLADLRGLNPFFGSRTLTLIDTHRVVQTNQGDGFDLNFIPNIIVQRIDTVTGGASAAYGSGAISGVVNVILNRKLEGGLFDADGYQTEHSDGRDRHVAAAYGHSILDDRVHFEIAGEFEHQDAVGCQDARSWCAQDNGWIQTGGITQASGFAETALYSKASGLRSAVISPAGAFFPTLKQYPIPYAAGVAPPTYQLTADGTSLVPYTIGTIPYSSFLTPATNLTTVIGGDGTPTNEYVNLLPESERGLISGMIDAKITDNIKFTSDWNWGKVTSQTGVFGNTTTPAVSLFDVPTVGVNITPQNAYVQQLASLGDDTLLNAVNAGYDSLNKNWFPQEPLDIYATTTVKRFDGEFEGSFPGSDWVWDASYSYGLTNRQQYEPDETRAASLQMALDSVIGPNGQPECRVTAAGGIAGVQNPSNPYYNPDATYAFYEGAPVASNVAATNNLLAQGCVPIDPFGTGAIPANALAYSFGALDEVLRYEQTVIDLDTSGNFWQGIGAGPFSAAAGFEWRQEVGNNNEVPSCLPGDSQQTCMARSEDFTAQFGTPFGGLMSVDEVYGEVNLPMAKDLPFAHLAELDIAARESRYDMTQLYAEEPNPNNVTQLQLESGQEATHDLTTWKISGFYDPIEGIRFRGSESHDMRNPDLRELYYAQQLTGFNEGGYGTCAHPGVATTVLDSCTWNLLGNVNLAPETANTTTLGIVLTPVPVPGLQLSADWWHIRLDNAISAANVAQVEEACGGGNAAACKQIIFNTDKYNTSGQDCTTPAAGVPPPNCSGTLVTGAQAWQDGALNGTAINATSYNGAFYDEKGVDFSVSYVISLPDQSTLFLRSLATWTGTQLYQNYPGGPVINILGQTGGIGLLGDYTPAPKWTGNMSITWTKGPLSITPSMNWVGHGKLSALGVTPSSAADRSFTGGPTACAASHLDLYEQVACGLPSATIYGYTLLPYNYVPSYFLFNLNGTLSFDDKLGFKNIQLFVEVNNLFNRQPPFAAAPGGLFGAGTGGTNPILFDTLGLATRAGFRLSF